MNDWHFGCKLSKTHRKVKSRNVENEPHLGVEKARAGMKVEEVDEMTHTKQINLAKKKKKKKFPKEKRCILWSGILPGWLF